LVNKNERSKRRMNFKFTLTLAAFFMGLFLIINSGCNQSAIDPDRSSIGNPYVALVIEPKDARIITGSYKQFAANAVDLEGKYTSVKPSWTVTYGAINDAGEYSAPELPGYSLITAKYENIAASSQIYVESSKEMKNFFIIPESGEIEVGRCVQMVFRAQNAGGDFLGVIPSWSSDIGNVTNTGFFSAPQRPATAKITARIGRQEAYAHLEVIAASPQTMVIFPETASVEPKASRMFSALAYDKFGNIVSAKGASWHASYGYIDSNGLYTSPDVTAEAKITANIGNIFAYAYANPSKGTIPKTIDISPANAVLRVGESRQFTAIAYDVDGNQVTLSPAATWSATNGFITSSGMFTAYPSTPGLATVTAAYNNLSKQITLLITQ